MEEIDMVKQKKVTLKKLVGHLELFWGEIIKEGEYLGRVALLDGKRVPYQKNMKGGTGYAEQIGCLSSNRFVVGDQGVFQYILPFASIGNARHVDFGEEVQGKVVKVEEEGAQLRLVYKRGTNDVFSDIHVVLRRSDYAIDADRSVVVPKCGQRLQGLVITKVDPCQKVVYVSLRPDDIQLAMVQQALNKGGAVQIVETVKDEYDKRHIQFTQLVGISEEDPYDMD